MFLVHGSGQKESTTHSTRLCLTRSQLFGGELISLVNLLIMSQRLTDLCLSSLWWPLSGSQPAFGDGVISLAPRGGRAGHCRLLCCSPMAGGCLRYNLDFMESGTGTPTPYSPDQRQRFTGGPRLSLMGAGKGERWG